MKFSQSENSSLSAFDDELFFKAEAASFATELKTTQHIISANTFFKIS